MSRISVSVQETKGRYALPVNTARIYGPYLRPVYTGSAYRSTVYTARIYGPYKTSIVRNAFRLYGPYLRVVCTQHGPYIRVHFWHPYIRHVHTGRTAKTATNNSRYKYFVRNCWWRHATSFITRNGKYLPSYLFCRKNTTYIASSLFRSWIGEMSVSEDDAAYFPRCSDTQFWADNIRPIYTGELFDTRTYGCQKCTRKYRPYVRVSKMYPYVRAIPTARTYGPYVWVVRFSFKWVSE